MALADSDTPAAAVKAAEGIGLKGHDPGAYFVTDHPTKGAGQYSFVCKVVTYRFASEKNLNRFKLNRKSTSPVWRLLRVRDVPQPHRRHRSVSLGGRVRKALLGTMAT